MNNCGHHRFGQSATVASHILSAALMYAFCNCARRASPVTSLLSTAAFNAAVAACKSRTKGWSFCTSGLSKRKSTSVASTSFIDPPAMIGAKYALSITFNAGI